MKTVKNSLIAILLLLFVVKINAQNSKESVEIFQLPEIYISEGVNILFISPEPIQFVDLSTKSLTGDLPSENIARVKIDSSHETKLLDLSNGQKSYGIITVVGQSFMAQYRTVYRAISDNNPITNIQIQPEDMQPLEFPKIQFSFPELKRFSMDIFNNKKAQRKPLRKKRKFKMNLQLNNVYVYNDYVFLDISLFNKSDLGYTIEDVKFTIEDKKIYKATNNQSVVLKPIYKLTNHTYFRKKYRNVFVFKKFTFPNGKVLNIRVLENPISGRTIELKIKYSDILNADVF